LLSYIGCSHKKNCDCNNLINYVVKDRKYCVVLFPLPNSASEFGKWQFRFSKLYNNGCSISVLGVPQMHTPEVFLVLTPKEGKLSDFVHEMLKQYARCYIADVYIRMPSFYTGLMPVEIVNKQYNNYRHKTLVDKLILKYRIDKTYKQIDQEVHVRVKPPILVTGNEFNYDNVIKNLSYYNLQEVSSSKSMYNFVERLLKAKVKYIPWHFFDITMGKYGLDPMYKRIFLLFVGKTYDFRPDGMFLKGCELPIHSEMRVVRTISGQSYKEKRINSKCTYELDGYYKPKPIEDRDNDFYF